GGGRRQLQREGHDREPRRGLEGGGGQRLRGAAGEGDRGIERGDGDRGVGVARGERAGQRGRLAGGDAGRREGEVADDRGRLTRAARAAAGEGGEEHGEGDEQREGAASGGGAFHAPVCAGPALRGRIKEDQRSRRRDQTSPVVSTITAGSSRYPSSRVWSIPRRPSARSVATATRTRWAPASTSTRWPGQPAARRASRSRASPGVRLRARTSA